MNCTFFAMGRFANYAYATWEVCNQMLILKNVSKHYQQNGQILKVLTDVNMEVYEGDTICLVGKSGEGKTTLLRIISGLCRPDSGEVWFNKANLYNLPEKHRSKLRLNPIGVIHQHSTLIDELSCSENIQFPLRMCNRPMDNKWFSQIVDTLGIGSLLNEFPTSLSGGQRKRIEIARVLLQTPRLLIADEPTANLDLSLARTVKDLFITSQSNFGNAIIFSTHDISLIETGWNIFTIQEGKLCRRERKALDEKTAIR